MILIGTDSGLCRWSERTKTVEPFGLEGIAVRNITAAPEGLVFVLDRHGRVWQSPAGGSDWVEMTPPELPEQPTCLLAVPQTGQLYLGTRPPALYCRRFSGSSWELLSPLHRLPMAEEWYDPVGLPFVRSMAVAPESPAPLYLNIHVGGVLRSQDGGQSWQASPAELEEDVHEVCTSPATPDAVFAATADGFYFSPDLGARWQARNEGLDRRYCRAVAVDPLDANTVLISGSPTPPPGWRRHGKRFGLYRSTDGGRSWQRVEQGLPSSADDVIDTGCLGFSYEKGHPGHVLCGYKSGKLFMSDDAGASWTLAVDNLGPIHSVVAG